MKEKVTALTTTYQNMAKEKQFVQFAAALQFRHPPPFPERFQKQKQDK